MVRSYGDPVQVRESVDETAGGAGGSRPQAFLWRGRFYVVRDVLAHWYERRAWWTEGAARAVHGEQEPGEKGHAPGSGPRHPSADREIWRVEASAGRHAGTGVYDLCRNPDEPDAGRRQATEEQVLHVLAPAGTGSWRLLRVAD